MCSEGVFEGAFPACAEELRLRALVVAGDVLGLSAALAAFNEVGFPLLCWAVAARRVAVVEYLVEYCPYQLEVAEEDGRSPAECAAESLVLLRALRCWQLSESERLRVMRAAPLDVLCGLVEYPGYRGLVPRLDLALYFEERCAGCLLEFMLFFERWVDVMDRRVVCWGGRRTILDVAVELRDGAAIRYIVEQRRMPWRRVAQKYGVEKLHGILHTYASV